MISPVDESISNSAASVPLSVCVLVYPVLTDLVTVPTEALAAEFSSMVSVFESALVVPWPAFDQPLFPSALMAFTCTS